MKKIALPLIIGISVSIAVGIAYAGMAIDEPIFVNKPIDNSNVKNQTNIMHPNAIVSGPLTITEQEYMLTDNIFIIVSGLGFEEKGNIRIIMPDGRLYKTLQYDGAVKNSFNSYFKPDTSTIRKICEQEELVGVWRVLFDNNAYPPLEFEIINQHRDGPSIRLPKAC